MTGRAGSAIAEALGRRDGSVLQQPLRVMIVDDSIVARAVLSRVITADDDFEVVVQAATAEQAIAALRTTRVDIVTLDVEMPGTDGLAALPEILRLGRGARVLLVSSIAEDGAAAAVQALALGAADTLAKPGGGGPRGNFAQALISKLRTIGHSRREGAAVVPPLSDPRLDRIKLRLPSPHPIRCLAIGASTGGLHALGEFLDALPARIGVPIVVTQHLPAVFMPYFARQIAALTGRSAHVADDGAALVPDCILIAPGDGHLCLEDAGHGPRVRIDRSGSIGGCLPSVDPMFTSVCDHYGASACAVVLTGMGRDGLAGSARLADAGASILVQDPASSAVWGMPRSVAEAGHACAILDPAAIARRIALRPGFARADRTAPGAERTAASSWK